MGKINTERSMNGVLLTELIIELEIINIIL